MSRRDALASTSPIRKPCRRRRRRRARGPRSAKTERRRLRRLGMTTLRALIAAAMVVLKFGWAVAKLPPPAPLDAKAKAAAEEEVAKDTAYALPPTLPPDLS